MGQLRRVEALHWIEAYDSLQPNPATQAHQVELWSKLVLDWARAVKVFSIDVEAGGADVGEVFENKAIKRELAGRRVGSITRGRVVVRANI